MLPANIVVRRVVMAVSYHTKTLLYKPMSKKLKKIKWNLSSTGETTIRKSRQSSMTMKLEKLAMMTHR